MLSLPPPRLQCVSYFFTMSQIWIKTINKSVSPYQLSFRRKKRAGELSFPEKPSSAWVPVCRWLYKVLCQPPPDSLWRLGIQWFSGEVACEASVSEKDWHFPTRAEGEGRKATYIKPHFWFRNELIFSPSPCRSLWRPPRGSLPPLYCHWCGSTLQCRTTAAFLWWQGLPWKWMSGVSPADGNVSPDDPCSRSEKANRRVSTQQIWKCFLVKAHDRH